MKHSVESFVDHRNSHSSHNDNSMKNEGSRLCVLCDGGDTTHFISTHVPYGSTSTVLVALSVVPQTVFGLEFGGDTPAHRRRYSFYRYADAVGQTDRQTDRRRPFCRLAPVLGACLISAWAALTPAMIRFNNETEIQTL
jgi:hypothetical protein